MTVKLVVLISGNGSNLQAILDACEKKVINAKVVAVISNNSGAFGLVRAEKAGINTIVLPNLTSGTRIEYDKRLADIVEELRVDFVILAGWMRLLSSAFLQRFQGKVINIHPALPGFFPGTHAIERSFDAFLIGEVDRGGVMVHYVPDEGVDSGPILMSREIFFRQGETLDQFEARIHDLEHILLVEALQKLISGKIN